MGTKNVLGLPLLVTRNHFYEAKYPQVLLGCGDAPSSIKLAGFAAHVA
jgi:hypothetical protein